MTGQPAASSRKRCVLRCVSTSEDRFFAAVADRALVRPSLRCIVVRNGHVLVQRPADSSPGTSYAFIGGEYETGDTFDSRVRAEFEEETNAKVLEWHYLFVVENLFRHGGSKIHALEHYVEVTIDRTDVASREGHLVQEWLPMDALATADLRPYAVRDLLASGRQHEVRHLVVNGWSED